MRLELRDDLKARGVDFALAGKAPHRAVASAAGLQR
jgi:hypothetical protein